MKRILLFSFVFIFISCSKKNTANKMNLFKILYESSYGDVSNQKLEVIDNKEKLLSRSQELQIPDEIYSSFNINFNKEFVIVVHLGEKTSGGYAIKIQDLENSNGKCLVKTLKTSPNKGEYVTSVITHPFCMARVPKCKQYILEE